MTRLPKLQTFAGAFCLMTAVGSSCARAEAIRDDFTSPEISTHWMACQREENEFEPVRLAQWPFHALKLTVHPRPDLAVFSVMFYHAGCMNGGGPYEPEKNDERAEIWESEPDTLQLGTEVWYRFAFLVDPDTPKTTARLVVGQWKQSNSATGDSPIIAQRFDGRTFSITVEQDNTTPGHAPEDTQCRVWVAVERSAVKLAGGSEPHALLWVQSGSEPPRHPPELPSVAHDQLDISHATAFVPGGASPSCKQDLTVAPLGFLPDPFGHWVTMLYHTRLNGPDSLLEVWADGQPIARVTGRIGFKTNGPGRQYLKFGPYRRHQPYSTYAEIAHYARGFQRKEVEP
jgi:hypothetical protein